MKCSMMELLEKPVINAATGERIGNLCDVEIDTQTASISAFIVVVKSKNGSLLGKCEKVCIDWCNIRVIGKDAILVDCCTELKQFAAPKSFLDKIWN
ncbi:MAG: YlmC/YmxH family sporulation protein [Clostridia bacterium]|nr:YlmC/YmxH family sporulation protein [Clostridia bacterium]